MFMKNFFNTKIRLISVTLLKIRSFLIRPIKVIGRMKKVFEGKATGEFVHLKSKDAFYENY